MEEGRRKEGKKRRKLDKLVDWGETPVGVDVEEARRWLCTQDMKRQERNSIQEEITKFTVGTEELFRRMVEAFVSGDLMDTVWRLVMDREEAKECTLALELDLADELKMPVLGDKPSLPAGQVDKEIKPNLKHST